jgi:hypothetical protein
VPLRLVDEQKVRQVTVQRDYSADWRFIPLRMMLGGLPTDAAGELLAAAAGARVDGRVSAQVVAGVAGNPLVRSYR